MLLISFGTHANEAPVLFVVVPILRQFKGTFAISGCAYVSTELFPGRKIDLVRPSTTRTDRVDGWVKADYH